MIGRLNLLKWTLSIVLSDSFVHLWIVSNTVAASLVLISDDVVTSDNVSRSDVLDTMYLRGRDARNSGLVFGQKNLRPPLLLV